MSTNYLRQPAVMLFAFALMVASAAQAPAAELTYDLRIALTGQPAGVRVFDAHTAGVSSPGIGVKLELYAVITNTNNTQTDDGFEAGQGSFVSSSGGLLGNLRGDASDTTTTQVNLVAPFNDVAIGKAASGFANDLDADTDTDVGNLTNTASGNANTWFHAGTANGMQFGAATSAANLEFLIGTNVFTTTSVGARTATLLDFIPRNRTIGGGAAQTNVYEINGTVRQFSSGNASIAHLGSTIVGPLSPEPTSFVLMGLAGLCLLFCRQRRTR